MTSGTDESEETPVTTGEPGSETPPEPPNPLGPGDHEALEEEPEEGTEVEETVPDVAPTEGE